LEPLPRARQVGTRLQLDTSDDLTSRRDERLPARRLGRQLLLPAHSCAVAPRALRRLQVRQDLSIALLLPSPASPSPRRWLCAVQGLVTLAVLAFVGRSIAGNRSECRSLHVPVPLG